MSKTLFLFAMLSLLAAHGAGAANTPLDVESLPRSVYKGQQGTQVAVLRYAEQNWTEINPTVVLSQKDTEYKDVCFEGKFESFIGATGLKLTGVDGNIYFEDKSKRKLAPELRQLDNIWICGSLKPSRNGRVQDLVIYELAKLPPDAQRFENRFLLLESAKNIQALIELGARIDQSIKNTKNLNTGLGQFERMTALRDKCWATAVSFKEKEMRPNDANSCYEIALLYRDLMRRNNQYRTWVLKTLELNPDHGNAGKDAEQVLNMVRVGDKWMTRQDLEQLNKRLDEETLKTAQDKKNREKERAERLEREVAERTVKLLEFQAALRTSDPAARVGALTSLGDEIKNRLDAGFGLAAVSILANMNDDAAILPGLDHAAKSEHKEVRQLVYTSLAWRASHNDSVSQTAYDVLASALKAEREKEPARAAGIALAEMGGKKGIATLIAGLESNEPAVCDALIDALKSATQKPLQKKEEWQQWWSENKTR